MSGYHKKWGDWTPRQRAEVVRDHAQPRIRVEPGMAVKDLAALFQISKRQVELILAGADFPDDGQGSGA